MHQHDDAICDPVSGSLLSLTSASHGYMMVPPVSPATQHATPPPPPTAVQAILAHHRRHARSMTSYASFEELEASVPVAQLLPSAAFRRCAAHLPHNIDLLTGDELVRSMEIALTVHSKARVVLQCWVLLIMRRRAEARHEKDTLYDRLQSTTVSPQDKVRYRRGAMLLCHLLIEREQAEGRSLLDRYLVDFYFPWSSAINSDDTVYLQADVLHRVRQALDHMQQNDRRMTAAEWRELSRSSSAAGATALTPVVSLQPTSRLPPQRTPRSTDHDQRAGRSPSTNSRPVRASQHWSPPQPIAHKKRRRAAATGALLVSATAARHELETLKEAIELWARRLRRQLLHAARTNDKKQIRQVADELQAPPLQGCEAGGDGAVLQSDSAASTSNEDDTDNEDEPCETASSDGQEDGSDDQPRSCGSRRSEVSPVSDPQASGDMSSELAARHDCPVCYEEPRRVQQVWNRSCQHGCCGDCMHAWLSQRKRQCMHCRASILQLVDGSGEVFQHYDWTKWWRRRRQAEGAEANVMLPDAQ
jgi:hypothetical protein